METMKLEWTNNVLQKACQDYIDRLKKRSNEYFPTRTWKIKQVLDDGRVVVEVTDYMPCVTVNNAPAENDEVKS